MKAFLYCACAINFSHFVLYPDYRISFFMPLAFRFADYTLVGFQMVSSSFFQSIGMAGKAIFLSLTRQLIFLLPCLLILPHYWGTDGVWGSIPVADFIASITTGLMLGWQLKKFKTGGLNNTKDSVAL